MLRSPETQPTLSSLTLLHTTEEEIMPHHYRCTYKHTCTHICIIHAYALYLLTMHYHTLKGKCLHMFNSSFLKQPYLVVENGKGTDCHEVLYQGLMLAQLKWVGVVGTEQRH